jgi:hypothetical protein
MTDLTAIDILINPDEATLERSRAMNARLRDSVPTGYALAASHNPHTTTLHRKAPTPTLEGGYAAVEATIAATDTTSLTFETVAVRHADWNIAGQGYTVYVAEPSPQVLDFQAALIAALNPYIEAGGTAAAFVADAGEVINQATLDWVERYVPDSSGSNYVAHISLGFATLDDLETIEAEPFAPFPVYPTSIAIYHLGNNGNARTQLKAWPLTIRHP